MKYLLLTFFFLMISCSGNKLSGYKDNTPKLDLRTYLNGKTKAWGVLEKGNKITRRFTVEMETTWKGNEGVLKEYFTFDDGEKSERVWYISYSNDDTFTAKAADVIGIAKGKQAGNALQMKYVLDLKVGNKNYHVSLDDWMYQLDEKTLLNKSEIKKFGFTVAKLTIFFQKQ